MDKSKRADRVLRKLRRLLRMERAEIYVTGGLTREPAWCPEIFQGLDRAGRELVLQGTSEGL